MADGPSFFDQPETRAAIAALSETESMTLLVGAGVSYESGLPDWETLLRRMLVEVAAQEGLSGQNVDAFVQWTITQDGVRGAGAVVKMRSAESSAPGCERRCIKANPTSPRDPPLRW